MILVLLIVLILSVLGLSILGMASSNMQMGDVNRDYQSVFYIAESGIDYEVKGLNDAVENNSEDADDAEEFFTDMDNYFKDNFTGENYSKVIQVFDDQFGEDVTATVRVEGIGTWTASDTEHTYTLVSEGDIGGVKRQVASDIELSFTEGGSPDYYTYDVALFSLGPITLEGSGRIDGAAGTNTTEPGSINFGSSTGISEDLMISPNANKDTLFTFANNRSLENHVNHLEVMEKEREYPLPDYPEIPSLTHRGSIELQWNYHDITIDQDGYYDEIKTNSYTMNIDVGNGIRTLVVKNLYDSGKINVVGSGKLLLFVTNKFSLGGDGKFNPQGDDRSVMLYYSGSSTFQVAGACKLKGCVYVQHADTDITASGGVTGHVISGGEKVNITGASFADVRVIYAPNAYVFVGGSGSVKGAVIAKKCKVEGGSYIKYDAGATLNDAPGIGSGSSPPQVDVNVDAALEIDY